MVVPVLMVAAFVALVIFDDRRLKRHGFRRKQEPPSIRPAHRFDPSTPRVRAGARIQRGNATYPLVTVTFDADWLRVEGMPTYDVWIERARVTNVRVIPGYPLGKGLMFDSPDGAYDGVAVWLTRRRCVEVMTSLAERGWPASAGSWTSRGSRSA